jgi:hypothetical protein
MTLNEKDESRWKTPIAKDGIFTKRERVEAPSPKTSSYSPSSG